MTNSYVWHDSFICVTWLTDMFDMTHSYVWHDAFICVTWLTDMFDMTHSYVWHDSFICVTWLTDMFDTAHWHDCLTCAYATFTSGHDSIKHETWLTFVSVRLGSCLCVSWFLHTCTVTHPCRWHDLCIPVTYHTCHISHVSHMIGVKWIILLRDTTHSYVRRDVFTRVTWLMSISYCPASIHRNFKFRV